jgi:hypothetical protein
MYLGGDESLVSRDWIETRIRQGHGPLGALYPTRTWTAPNPHSAIKEGDTPSWFFFLPNGLGDPEHPDWGGWGGRFRMEPPGFWRDVPDTVGGETHVRATVWRWRPAFQADFEARLDWCVKPRAEANHAPRAVLNGDDSRAVLRLEAGDGAAVTLDAAGSKDSDGDELSYRWRIYGEASTVQAELGSMDGLKTRLTRTPGAGAGAVHVILEVTDDGMPRLTAHRRAVVEWP